MTAHHSPPGRLGPIFAACQEHAFREAVPSIPRGRAQELIDTCAKKVGVPTRAELGFKGAELDIWFGLWAPNGTPAEITARVGREVAKALALPGTRTRYEALGAEPVGLDNAEFKALLVNETRLLSGLIKEAKINID